MQLIRNISGEAGPRQPRVPTNAGIINLVLDAGEGQRASELQVRRSSAKKLLFLLAMLISFSFASELIASAANHYIRDGGTASTTGTGSCTSWETANACDQLPDTLVRGDTYYIADGTYSGKTFNTSGTALITIRKATASEHGTETGWVSTYGNGTATFTTSLVFSTANWLVDGVFGGGPMNWTGPFGFTSTHTGRMIELLNGSSGVTVQHIELSGVGSYSGGNAGLYSYACTNCTLSYWYMHDIGGIPFMSSATNLVVEYGYMKNWYDGPGHSEICSCWDFGNGVIGTHTFRYNLFTDLRSTGGIMWDNVSNHDAELRIYGNVFYKDPNITWNNTGNGVIAGWTGGNGEDFYNVHVINNSFIGIPGSEVLSTIAIRAGNNEAVNNLFYNVNNPGATGDWQVVTHNHFIATSLRGTATSSSSGSPFIDTTKFNFSLTAPTPAGTVLAAPYNVDMYGRTRGADGIWDRGAVEFVTGSDLTPPMSPTNLRIE